jgi:hypothetical protein
MRYSVKKFTNKKQAEVYRKAFRKDYGYSPTLFRSNGKFVIVKPSSLRKI